MNLATNDDILWQLFQMKVGTIQSEMLAQGELKSTPQGVAHVKLPQKKLFLTTQGKDPIATPPTTPVLPTEQLSDIVEMWDSMDGAAQVRMLKKMLRSAKNSQSVVFECEDFCAEFRYDKAREARNNSEQPAVSRLTKEMSAESTQEPTPSKTPDPTSTGLDLQAMIDKSLRAMRTKRAREKKALESCEDEVDYEEDTERKRMKIEPFG